MTTSISAQVLTEIKELRTDIHGIDTKLEVHLAQDDVRIKNIDKLSKVVFGNGNKGLEDRVLTLEERQCAADSIKTTQTKFKLDIKSGAIIGGISLLMSILEKIFFAKLF